MLLILLLLIAYTQQLEILVTALSWYDKPVGKVKNKNLNKV